MCGIAGFSLSPASWSDRTLAAQALLAGIADRGRDAVGYCWRAPGRPPVVHKQRSGASALLTTLDVADDATEALIHVRHHTRGHPDVTSNNHPVRHGSVVGVHNGTIVNDEAVFQWLGRKRHRPGTTVDSEAIFMLADLTRSDARAFEMLRGTMASAWLDEREPGRLYLARGTGRPLWLGHTTVGLFFASTRSALEVLAGVLLLRLDEEEVDEGVALQVRLGEIERRQSFRPDPGADAETQASTPAPHEADRCLHQLVRLAQERGQSPADRGRCGS
jgi:glucosamine 6-phosphate synthetase-like amidotransferase/phosphosugar isomerase protein